MIGIEDDAAASSSPTPLATLPSAFSLHLRVSGIDARSGGDPGVWARPVEKGNADRFSEMSTIVDMSITVKQTAAVRETVRDGPSST